MGISESFDLRILRLRIQVFEERELPQLTYKFVEGFFLFEHLTYKSNRNPPLKPDFNIDFINHQWRYIEVVAFDI